ncbi:MAG: peroxide stress protein YaaA [Naasia sp.]
MLLLLPPSETKRDGGDGPALQLAELRYPELSTRRRAVIRSLTGLARDPAASMKALKISARQTAEVERNRAITTSPTMPAIDRYTGVLFDALDSATLPAEARARAAGGVVVQSALLGPVGGMDAIPAYRLSHDSRLHGLPLKAQWSEAAGRVISAEGGLILDLRSQGYAALGPLAPGADRRYLRVVTRGSDGVARALNHFNKSAKGVLARALLRESREITSVQDLLDWAEESGVELVEGAPGELDLVVPPGPWRLDDGA